MEPVKPCEKCLEFAKELDKLTKMYQELKTENTKYKILLKDVGLDDDPSTISDQEAICVEQLKRLKEISTTKKFSAEDAKVLDLLHLNLVRARGGKVDDTASKKAKKLSEGDLLKLVQDLE